MEQAKVLDPEVLTSDVCSGTRQLSLGRPKKRSQNVRALKTFSSVSIGQSHLLLWTICLKGFNILQERLSCAPAIGSFVGLHCLGAGHLISTVLGIKDASTVLVIDSL